MAATNPPEPQQLVLWEDNLRAMPVAFARGALFRAAAKGQRRRIDGQIAAAPGITVRYTGEELRTDDEDLLMSLLHNLRGKNLRDPEQLKVQKYRHELLRDLERNVTGDYYRDLERSLDRLAEGTLKVTYRNPTTGKLYKVTQSIIRKVAVADKDGPGACYTIWVEPEILQFFSDSDDYYKISWQDRVRLGRPLSKWTHATLQSLRLPLVGQIGLKLADVLKLSGSEASSLASFKVILRRCLEEMRTQGVIGAYSFARNGFFFVSKPGISDINSSAATIFDLSMEKSS